MLKTRIVTALFLATGLLAGLFLLPPDGSTLLFTAMIAIAAWEWAGLLRMRAMLRWVYGALICLPCAALYLSGMPGELLTMFWWLALGFWLLLVPLWFSRRWTLRADVLGFLVGWLLLIPGWAAMVTLQARSPWLLLAAMALVWVADIAAYAAGRAFGKHKLAITISPGKTWEGAFGAVAGVLIYGLAVGSATGRLASFTASQILFALFGLLLLTAVSILGDLFESLAKRQAGVKDSSMLLPGHGGVLDRIDSLTSTLPLVALVTVLFT